MNVLSSLRTFLVVCCLLASFLLAPQVGQCQVQPYEGPFANLIQFEDPNDRDPAQGGGGDPLRGLNLSKAKAYAATRTIVNGYNVENKGAIDPRDDLNVDTFVSSVAYLQGMPEDGGPGSTEDFIITTIFGIDLDPNGDPIGVDYDMTGFDPNDPEAQVLDETFIGISGTVYPADAAMSPEVAIGDLATLLPGADLSVFSNGDPNSIVYLFTATLPVADFTIPEPAAIVLVACALGVFGGRRFG